MIPVLRRVCAYGYRIGEVYLKAIGVMKPSVKISYIRDSIHDSGLRHFVSVSLGCHFEDCSLPKPDMFHHYTAVGGAMSRFLTDPPKPDPVLLAELKAFVKDWLEKKYD